MGSYLFEELYYFYDSTQDALLFLCGRLAPDEITDDDAEDGSDNPMSRTPTAAVTVAVSSTSASSSSAAAGAAMAPPAPKKQTKSLKVLKVLHQQFVTTKGTAGKVAAPCVKNTESCMSVCHSIFPAIAIYTALCEFEASRRDKKQIAGRLQLIRKTSVSATGGMY